MTKLHELLDAGQSIWFDYIRRDMVRDGGLAELVARGVRGVTSNPSIFEKAIADSTLYDAQIHDLGACSPEEAFDELAIVDIAEAADVLLPVYESSDGGDGYVSLEVSPRLAHDTSGTIADAMRLWGRVDRPNLMIKVPATAAGIPAVEELIASGINVNATLMFSLADYEAVATAYLRGLERASDPRRIASVASFFVSRVDTYADEALEALGSSEASALRGTLAVANAQAAYHRYLELFDGEAFADLAGRGAQPQRVLWASTSTKNPAYRDVMYVEELIGPNTVNTAPPATLEAFEDHGIVKTGSLLEGIDAAVQRISTLDEIGLDFADITGRLQTDGVASFAAAYEGLIEAIAHKQEVVRA